MLTWFGGQKVKKTVKILHQLKRCKFDFDQSELKSTQVHAKPGQTGSKVDLSFELASTAYESVWPRL